MLLTRCNALCSLLWCVHCKIGTEASSTQSLHVHAVKKTVTLRFYNLEDEDDYMTESRTFTQTIFDRWMTVSCCVLLKDVTPAAPPASVMDFADLVDGHEYIVDVGICLLLL